MRCLFYRGSVLLLMLVLSFTLVGCGGGGGSSVTPVVYTGGFYYDSTSHAYVPCYWRDSTQFILAPTGSSYATVTAITVSGGKVYSGGYNYNGSTFSGGYWEDTTFHPHSESNAWIGGLGILNNGVYTNGVYSSSCTPTLWCGNNKNPYDLELPTGDTRGDVRTMFVIGSTVYSGGSTNAGTIATAKPCYWEGTTRKSLPLGTYTRGQVVSMTVSGGKVYTCGWVYSASGQFPCYWEDQGNPVVLACDGSTYAEATGIGVFNSKIYISGWYAGASVYPCLWKLPDQTTPQVLTVPTGSNGGNATAIFVFNGTPYLAGWYQMNAGAQEYPCYWNGTSGERTQLPNPMVTNGSKAFTIFVTGN